MCVVNGRQKHKNHITMLPCVYSIYNLDIPGQVDSTCTTSTRKENEINLYIQWGPCVYRLLPYENHTLFLINFQLQLL